MRRIRSIIGTMLVFCLGAATSHATSKMSAKRFPASFQNDQASLENMTLQQVYAVPFEEVERLLYKGEKPNCSSDSAISNGAADPAKLTSGELCAVVNYSLAEFERINPRLWQTDSSGSALNGRDWAYVRVLDSAIKKMKPEPLTTVYRGTSRIVKFSNVGQKVRLKGYTSTSIQEEVALQFIKEDARVMVIKTRSARNLQIYSNAGTEAEYLLPRSTWVRFDKADNKKISMPDPETGNDKSYNVEYVYLTEIPAPSP